MKMLTFILLIFFPVNIFTQEEAGDSHYELFFGTSNCTGQINTFNVISLNALKWNVDFLLTDEFEGGSITLVGNTNINNGGWRNGFDFLRYSGQTFTNDQYGRVLGYTVYLIKALPSNISFYLDYRDTRYWESYGNNFPYSIDLFLLYDNGTFKIKRVHDSNYQTISNKQYLKVSDIYELSGNNINNFENYWINCLVLTDNGNNKPKIRWWSHPNYFQYQIEGYKIYYSFHNNGYPPELFTIWRL